MGRKVLLVWATMAALSLTAFLASAQAAGDPKAGKAKYDVLCAGCHGVSGRGDGPAAAALNPKPRDHTDPKYMGTLTDEDIFKITKTGGPAVGKSPLMPAWGGQLSDQDIRNISAYIRSLAKPGAGKK